jgi:hypothetical protein
MPRIPKNVATTRLNLELSQAVRDRIEELRDQTGADSMTEVIRNALAVYEFLHRQVRRGGSVRVESAAGEAKEVVLVPSLAGR